MDAATLAMAEPLANFSRWMCPNERTSCSVIAASASQLPQRCLVRTQRIGKRVNLPLEDSLQRSRSRANMVRSKILAGEHKLARLLPECNNARLADYATGRQHFASQPCILRFLPPVIQQSPRPVPANAPDGVRVGHSAIVAPTSAEKADKAVSSVGIYLSRISTTFGGKDRGSRMAATSRLSTTISASNLALR